MTLRRQWAFATIGLAAGFSGAAVIISILSGVALWLTEAALVLVPLAGTIIVARRAPRPLVLEVWRVVRAGLLVGFAATLLYDSTRTILSVLDPSPYNPFEAIRQFGLGLLPEGAPPAAVLAAGFALHFVNGSSFGVIYAVSAGRRARTLRDALLGGVIWGLTLELIMSILYPGWLRITTVLQEFLLISSLGHLVYGVTLGLGVRRLLHQEELRESVPSPP